MNKAYADTQDVGAGTYPPRVRTAVIAATLVLALPAAAAPGRSSAADRAHETMRALAALGPRVAGSVGERRAARLVSARLRSHGYAVATQVVALPDGRLSLNVVGRTSGAPRLVLVAHIDSVRSGVGANDNASGVSVMLELARELRREQGVVVAGVGAEERAETGSRIHLGSERLARSFSPRAKRGIRLALVLDMVGVGRRLHVRGIEPRPNASARAVLARSRRVTYLRDAGLSDHAELTRAGIPAAWIQWRDDGCWHAACDRPARVRRDRLAAALAAALGALRTPAS